MKILKLNSTRLRLFLGAATGSAYSLKIFLPQANQSAEFLLRMLICGIIVIIAYKISTTKQFILSYTGFLIISFVFSGLITSIIVFFNPKNLIYHNGIIYYDISFLNIVVLSTVCFLFITIAEKFLKKKVSNNFIFETTVTYNNRSVTGRGLADTGNSLKEPFSGDNVIVADYKAIKSIVPPGIKNYITSTKLTDEKIRLIPVTTINGVGLLPAFRIDKATVKSTTKTIEINNVFLAVSDQQLCAGEFEFILNNSFTEVDEIGKNKRTIKKT